MIAINYADFDEKYRPAIVYTRLAGILALFYALI
jgi:hypothetical protein